MIIVKSKKRRPAVLSPAVAQKRFNELVAKLASSTAGEERDKVRKDLAHVARILQAYARETNRKRSSVPMPKSYIEYIETAARISGRKTIRAHMVQGGAPGTGGGGRRK